MINNTLVASYETYGGYELLYYSIKYVIIKHCYGFVGINTNYSFITNMYTDTNYIISINGKNIN